MSQPQAREKRGRKRSHPNPLPDIQAIAAIRALHRVMDKNKWSELQTRKEYEQIASSPAFSELDEKETNYAQFHFDADTFKKAASRNRDTNKSLNDYNKWGIYLWMREIYPEELKSALTDEAFWRREEELYAFHSLCGYKSLDTERALTLRGSYNLYRPAHFDPVDSILIQRFVVGGNDETEMFDCALTGEYEKLPGVVIDDKFTGKIAPQDSRAAAILPAPHNLGGWIIIHFDDIEINYAKKEAISMSGLMVTALGNGRSSAWPLYAERVNPGEPISNPIILRSDFSTLPERIVEALDRGAVHWEAKHHQRSLTDPRQA